MICTLHVCTIIIIVPFLGSCMVWLCSQSFLLSLVILKKCQNYDCLWVSANLNIDYSIPYIFEIHAYRLKESCYLIEGDEVFLRRQQTGPWNRCTGRKNLLVKEWLQLNWMKATLLDFRMGKTTTCTCSYFLQLWSIDMQGWRNRSSRPGDCRTNVWVYRPEIDPKCSYSIHRTLVNTKHLTLQQIPAHSARLLKSMDRMRRVWGVAKNFVRT